MILELDKINTFYGSSHILFDLSLNIERGEGIALMGRNGAGKTTTLRSILNLTPIRSGRISYKGMDIAKKRTYALANMGIGLVPEGRHIFAGLKVLENLSIVTRSKGVKGGWTVEKIFNAIPLLKGLANRDGGTLSGGEQQTLAVARALMGNPELLLLDEPFEGLAPVLIDDLAEIFLNLKREGMTMLLTEQQHMDVTLGLVDRVYLLDKGDIKYHGDTEDFKGRKEFQKKYLAV